MALRFYPEHSLHSFSHSPLFVGTRTKKSMIPGHSWFKGVGAEASDRLVLWSRQGQAEFSPGYGGWWFPAWYLG
jgi:hypothetical protein